MIVGQDKQKPGQRPQWSGPERGLGRTKDRAGSVIQAQIPQLDGEDDPETGEKISYDSDNSDRGGININMKKNCARMLITNASSLLPKFDSMVDEFQSLDLHFAYLTEDEKGIRIIHKSRDGRKKKSGGGVAIAFNTSA